MTGDRLDIAIDNFFDEQSDLSLSQRMNELRNAFMWNAGRLLKKIGKKEKISEPEEYRHIEGMKFLAQMEKVYNSQLRAAKAEGKTTDQMDKEWLKEIKIKASTISPIVRDMNEFKTGT
jgi:hypothetical protein